MDLDKMECVQGVGRLGHIQLKYINTVASCFWLECNKCLWAKCNPSLLAACQHHCITPQFRLRVEDQANNEKFIAILQRRIQLSDHDESNLIFHIPILQRDSVDVEDGEEQLSIFNGKYVLCDTCLLFQCVNENDSGPNYTIANRNHHRTCSGTCHSHAAFEALAGAHSWRVFTSTRQSTSYWAAPAAARAARPRGPAACPAPARPRGDRPLQV